MVEVQTKACGGACGSRRQHVLLCALSTLYTPRKGYPAFYEYTVQGFDKPPYTSYVGWHTNEAPSQLLFDLANAEGRPIDRVVYLCSDTCRDVEVCFQRFDGTMWQGTAEAYFRHALEEHMERRGLSGYKNEGFFVPIPYATEKPEAMLAEVIGELGNNVLVDVDASGAMRDAQILLYQVINFLKAGSREDNVSLGKVVYASLKQGTNEGRLTNQEETYALSELVDAVDAFTRYGKADMLVDWFAGKDNARQVQNLCTALRDFSADLSLCRMGKIDSEVKTIHERFDQLEEAAKAKDASAWVVLMASLVPTMRAGFVRPLLFASDRDAATQTIEIIRWCVERQFLQQALALVREKVPVMLVQLGYLRQREFAPSVGSEKWVTCIVELSNNVQPAEDSVSALNEEGLERVIDRVRNSHALRSPTSKLNSKQRKKVANHVARICYPAEVANGELVEVNADRIDSLRAALVWFHYLRTVRNDVMHANEDGKDHRWSRRHLAQGCELTLCNRDVAGFDFGCRYDRAKTSVEVSRMLAEDIELCLKALEGEIRFELKQL